MTCYLRVGDIRDLPPGSITVVSGIDRVDVCVINLEGKFYAVSGICPHKGGPLSKGTLKGKYLECPWHYACFQVDNGRHSWPAERDLRTFNVKVDGTSILIET